MHINKTISFLQITDFMLITTSSASAQQYLLAHYSASYTTVPSPLIYLYIKNVIFYIASCSSRPALHRSTVTVVSTRWGSSVETVHDDLQCLHESYGGQHMMRQLCGDSPRWPSMSTWELRSPAYDEAALWRQSTMTFNVYMQQWVSGSSHTIAVNFYLTEQFLYIYIKSQKVNFRKYWSRILTIHIINTQNNVKNAV